MTKEQFDALVEMISALIQNEGYDTYVGDELDAVARAALQSV